MEAIDVANALNDLYLDNRRNPFWLTKEEFKRIAGRHQLRVSFLREVRSHLREHGYRLVSFCEVDRVLVVHCTAFVKDRPISHAKNVDEYFLPPPSNEPLLIGELSPSREIET